MAGPNERVTMNIRGWEPIILLVIVLLLFGASRLPGLARSMGRSARIFRDEVTGKGSDDTTDDDDGEHPKS